MKRDAKGLPRALGSGARGRGLSGRGCQIGFRSGHRKVFKDFLEGGDPEFRLFAADAVGRLDRVGITQAAGSLLKRKLIHYSRGTLTVLDRRGLKAAACGCYAADLESYSRVFAAH